MLLYTKWFGDENPFDGKKIDYCGQDSPKCVLTRNVDYLEETIGLMFHVRDVELESNLFSFNPSYFSFSSSSFDDFATMTPRIKFHDFNLKDKIMSKPWILFSGEPPIYSVKDTWARNDQVLQLFDFMFDFFFFNHHK